MDATGLTQQMRDMDLQDMVIENDVLFYLQKNHKGSTLDQIKSQCKGNFAEPEIFGARQFLQAEYLTVLSEHDPKLGKILEKPRRKGSVNDAIDSVIKDLIDSIDAIEACKTKITIIAKNADKIPVYNSEAVQIKCILERLDKAETDICQLKLDYESVTEENKGLRSDNQELREEVIKLTAQLSGNNGEGQSADTKHDPPSDSAPISQDPFFEIVLGW